MFKNINRENKKGFTLAELLIVVAIIGVLVAISIPIFTSQLEKSRDSVSVSNLRAAYAEAASAWLTGTGDGSNVTVDKDAKTVTVSGVEFKGTNSSDNFSSLRDELPFSNASSLAEPAAGAHQVTFDFSSTTTDEPSVSIT